MSFGLFSFIFVVVLSLAIGFAPTSAEAVVRKKPRIGLKKTTGGGDCWDPEKDPVISKFMKPEAKYHENAQVMQQIHDTIWAHREEIDPRLVYHRIIGESTGNPFALSPDKKYYGLFQFGGTHKTAVQALMKKNSKASPRLLQVQYYFDKYVSSFVADANNGTGCVAGKKWSSYSNIERSVFLNQGRCNNSLLAHERSYCTSKSANSNYRNYACKFSQAVTNGRSSRLCERQNPGTRPARPIVPVRAPAARAKK